MFRQAPRTRLAVAGEDRKNSTMQLFGGASYTTDFPVERFMRDAKITQIHGGTSQIQRAVVIQGHTSWLGYH